MLRMRIMKYLREKRGVQAALFGDFLSNEVLSIEGNIVNNTYMKSIVYKGTFEKSILRGICYL